MVNPNSSPKNRLVYLFHLLKNKQASPSEKQELFQLLSDPALTSEVNQLILETWENLEVPTSFFTQEKSNELLESILDTPEVEKEKPSILPTFWHHWKSMAASILLLISMGTYFWVKKRKTMVPNAIASTTTVKESKSILTLGDGQQINLDAIPVGHAIHQGNISISKSADGSLIYTATSKSDQTQDPIEFNTISTPKGRRFQVILPDGTKVWLNTSTTLRYPTRFTGRNRQIHLKGEAYLEVKPAYTMQDGKKQKTTFSVATDKQIVEVLGTHFNINSYADEKNTKTTLLEGSIRIIGLQTGDKIILNPGQQSDLNTAGNLALAANADIEGAVAWKDNNFRFKNTDIHSVMNQLSRWYNVEIQYQGSIPDGHLTGFISQNVPISSVLHMLEQTSDLKFKLEGQKVMVYNPKTNLK